MASAHILQCLEIGILFSVKEIKIVFYTEGNRQVVIFLLRSANYDNVNAVSKLFNGSLLYWYDIYFFL